MPVLPFLPADPTAEVLRLLRSCAGRVAAGAKLPLTMTGGLLAVLGAVLLVLPARTPATTAVASPDAAAVWTRDPTAGPQLATRSADLAGVPQVASTWTRGAGATRETDNRLAVGTADDPRPMLQVSALRLTDAAPRVGLYVASVRMAAQTGLALVRYSRPSQHAGRFGETETARVAIAPASTPEAARPGMATRDCLSWRAASAEGGIDLIGIACARSGETIDETGLECLLRDLVPAPGADATLRQLLKPKGAACGVTIADLVGAASTNVARTRR